MPLAKKSALYDSAERLYVIDGRTFESIARELKTSDKTIRTWAAEAKADGNDWEVKRKQYVKSKQGFLQENYEFAKELMASLREDIKMRVPIDMARASLLRTLLSQGEKIKDYEMLVDNEKGDGETKGKANPEEVFEKINEILGLK